MNVTVRIPDDLAERLAAAGGDLEQRTLEALALAEYQAGRLTRPELQRMLGFTTPSELDAFLTAHGSGASATTTAPDPGTEARQTGKTLAAEFRAFRRGRTLGGVDPRELIREGPGSVAHCVLRASAMRG